MAAGSCKYAGLPDLDEAPDIFETPSLTDDVSTSAPLRSESRASSPDAASEEDAAIDRHRLNRDEARAHFLGSRVDAREADFSDRIDGERRSYRVRTSRRRRKGAREQEAGGGRENQDGGEESESSEEDGSTPEGLRRKLARLTREAAELKSEFQRRRELGEDGQMDGSEVGELDDTLGELNRAIEKGQKGAQERLSKRLNAKITAGVRVADQNGEKGTTDGSTAYTIAYAPSFDSSHALAKAASFDTRLSSLETVLGLDTISLPTQNGAYPKAVLPTLDILDRQLSTLSSTSGASLDTVSKRVRQLIQEAEKLEEARKAAKEAQDALAAATESVPRPSRLEERRAAGSNDLTLEDPEQIAKINALHGTLPTIEALAPVLPGLLDRLRSLRLIHADAAGASKSLSDLEKRQAEMDGEIREWRESLTKMEGLLGKGEESTKENMAVVEGWVKDLIERVKRLGA